MDLSSWDSLSLLKTGTAVTAVGIVFVFDRNDLPLHRTCLHNQPPPPGPDDSGPAAESNNSTTGADAEKPSDNGEEENEKTRHSPNNSPMATKSEPVQQQHNGADVLAKNSGGGGENISADLQKLQSMIMELNGSSSSEAVASAGGQNDGVRSDPHPVHHRPFSTCAATSSSQNTASDSPTTKCCPTAS